MGDGIFLEFRPAGQFLVGKPVRFRKQILIEMEIETGYFRDVADSRLEVAVKADFDIGPEGRILQLVLGSEILLGRVGGEIHRVLGLEHHFVQMGCSPLGLPVEPGIGHLGGINIDAPDVHHPHDQGQHNGDGHNDDGELKTETADFSHDGYTSKKVSSPQPGEGLHKVTCLFIIRKEGGFVHPGIFLVGVNKFLAKPSSQYGYAAK